MNQELYWLRFGEWLHEKYPVIYSDLTGAYENSNYYMEETKRTNNGYVYCRICDYTYTTNELIDMSIGEFICPICTNGDLEFLD